MDSSNHSTTFKYGFSFQEMPKYICLSLPTSTETQPTNMQPVTPLRRSERLRRPTPKAIGSSPGSGSSPGTVGHPFGSRPRVFYPPGGQTDSDSTLRNSTSSKSSGSCTEDTVGDGQTYAVGCQLPPKFHEPYKRLAPLLSLSDAELMK